jgi:polysaccharide biosynthesis transport protein
MNNGTRTAPLTLAERWQAVRRRRRPMLWAALAVLTLSVATTALWPATFRSSGTILIEQQELPSDLVQSTVTGYADERIQVISQRVMTTDNLLGIIQRYNLYPNLRKNQPREVLLAKMRKDIHFAMISADVIDPREGRATKADIAFSVSYDSHSPDTAARVANELVSLYLDENLRNRRQISADAENFLSGEAERLEHSIASLQAQLAQFKDKHINDLPDETVINRESLIRSQDELRDIDTQLRSLEQQSTYLDAQLAQISPSSQVYTSTGERVLSPSDRLKYLRTQYATLSAIYAPDHPDVVRTQREIEGLERAAGPVDSSNDLQRQLEDARAQLAQLQKRYAPDYPDVVRLQRRVTALTQQIAALPLAPGTKSSISAPPDNPAYIEIKAQRDANSAERGSLLDKRAVVQSTIDGLERRLAATPAVERDYDALVMQLDNEQLKYRDVRQKQMDAKLSENLEDAQKGERFTLIDPPLAPQQPTSPNRPLLLVLGLMLALGAGMGTVALLEGADGSVRDRRDLELLLEVPPLAVVPRMVTLAEAASRRWRRRAALVGTVGACALALLLTHLFYRPLDVLWDVALRKLGS